MKPVLDKHRLIFLHVTSIILGALGWSGWRAVAFIPLLMPVLYVCSRNRKEAAMATSYYAASTWQLLITVPSYFAHHWSIVIAAGLWISTVLCSGAPWILLFRKSSPEITAILSLLITTLPPIGLISVANPLAVAGVWFPATHLAGLIYPSVLLLLKRWLNIRGLLLSLCIGSGISHSVKTDINASVGRSLVRAVSTNFGDADATPLSVRLDTIAKEAQVSPGKILLFPEGAIPNWTDAVSVQLSAREKQWASSHTTVLIGTTVPIRGTLANRNMLISRGAGQPHYAYIQRVPIPIGMWKVGRDDIGYPLSLAAPPTIRVGRYRAAVLMCYEQLLMWPALVSLTRHPDFLLAPSNHYWAHLGTLPAIQKTAVNNWALLWNIPAFQADNK